MTQQGEIVKKPGKIMTEIGLVILVLGLGLLMMNLFNTVEKYVPGIGTVEVRTPSPGAIVLIIVGLLLAGIGFGRRLLAAAERR